MLLNAGQLFDVFTPEEINLTLTALSKLSDAPNRGDFFAYTNGFTPSDLIYKIINRYIVKKIEQSIGKPLNVMCGMHLKEVRPWTIHSDYSHTFDGGLRPDLAILIPLKIVNKQGAESGMTHTVIFNELSKTDFADYKQLNNKLSNHAGHIHETHCSHCEPETLEYVSLNGVYPWEPGSLIHWDRKMLHCSDNFLKNSIVEKQALVLFTTR